MGVCHSDAYFVNGAYPVEWPAVFGHEIAGRIDAVGAGVDGWRVGDRVAVGWFGGPFVVKRRVSRGGRRGGIVVDAPDVPEVSEHRWSALAGTHLVQEFAPGVEYATAVYAAPHGDAEPDLVVVLEKVGLARGSAGNALAVERVDGPAVHDVASLALTATRVLGLVGPAFVDVRRLPDGRPVILDVDARFVATTAAVPELLDRVLAGCRPKAAAAVC